MPGVSMILDDGKAARAQRAREYFDSEVQLWVKAAFERRFNLTGLDDRDLRLACITEYGRQLQEREKNLPDVIIPPIER